jgi:hypothetical protein
MKQIAKTLNSFFLPVLLFTCISVQSSTLFRQFSPFNTVSGIVSDGSNLWIATSGGAVKYTLASGAKKVYTDLNDLPDLNLVGAVQDRSGIVWFGSNEGYLVRLDPATESFTSFNALAIAGWPITCMLYFKDNIFIGTQNGLSIFSIEKSFIQNVKSIGTFTSVYISALRSYGDTLALVTDDGIAYCVSKDVALTIFSDPTLWTCIKADNTLGIIHGNDSLKASGYKVLEIGTTVWQYGVGNFLLKNGSMAGMFSSPVTCLLPLDNNSFVIGTQSSFFWIYNGSKSSYSQITVDGPAGSNIGGIGGCVLDRSGLLWYIPQDPTSGFGWFDGTAWQKINYQTNPDVGNMGAGMLTAKNTIMATMKNDIWVSTYAYGEKWLNRENGTWTSYIDPYGALPYVNAGNPFPPPYNPSPLTRYYPDTTGWWTMVSGVCEDSLGYIWVANYQPYTNPILNLRKPRENTWRSFSYGDTTYNLLSKYTGPVAANGGKTNQRQYIYLGYVHNEAQNGGGLSVLSYSSSDDPMTATVSCVSSDDRHTYPVSDIAVVNDTLVWLACGDGIYRMAQNDPNTIRKITTITSSDGFYAVAAGYGGRVVFCKDRDLFSYGDGDTTVTRLTSTGKLGASVNSIVLDKKNSVYWIASNKGLFRFETGDSTVATAGHSIDVYPNPVSRQRLKNGQGVRFRGLDFSNSTVRIFDAGGMLVTSISAQNRIGFWNGANQSGKVVVPGIYFYQAAVGNGKYAKGRIFVIP